MKIAVCDDLTADCTLLDQLVTAHMDSRQIESCVSVFNSGEALLAAISDGQQFAIYFLDIYMGGLSGVAAAFQIRRQSTDAVIVFTTTSPDYMAEGFELGAAHYILKPVSADAVAQALDRALRQTGMPERYINVTVDRTPHRLRLNDIITIESRDKLCVITTTGGELRQYSRLSDLETELDDARFLRCHRSFLINMDYASGIVDGEFRMATGTRVPIKRDKRQEMKLLFSGYCFDRLRKE